MDNYKQRNGYDYKQWRSDKSDDEAYNLKVTQPNQSISIKKLYERYEKRRQEGVTRRLPKQ